MCGTLITTLILAGLLGWATFHFSDRGKLTIQYNVNQFADWLKMLVNK